MGPSFSEEPDSKYSGYKSTGLSEMFIRIFQTTHAVSHPKKAVITKDEKLRSNLHAISHEADTRICFHFLAEPVQPVYESPHKEAVNVILFICLFIYRQLSL